MAAILANLYGATFGGAVLKQPGQPRLAGGEGRSGSWQALPPNWLALVFGDANSSETDFCLRLVRLRRPPGFLKDVVWDRRR